MYYLYSFKFINGNLSGGTQTYSWVNVEGLKPNSKEAKVLAFNRAHCHQAFDDLITIKWVLMPVLDDENWIQLEDWEVGGYGTWKQFQHTLLPILLREGEKGAKHYRPL